MAPNCTSIISTAAAAAAVVVAGVDFLVVAQKVGTITITKTIKSTLLLLKSHHPLYQPQL